MMSRGPHTQPFNRRFRTTRWSLVLLAGSDTSDASRQALGQLIECYWYPLYAYSRRCGKNEHDASDLTQGFFAHLLENHRLAAVTPTKGRFRSFLLAAFKNYAANRNREAQTLRRGGGVVIHPLQQADSEDRYAREPVTEETPERLYERSWVESLLRRVDARLAEDYQRAGKQLIFDFLHPHLKNRPDALPREEIARQLALSGAAIAMSLHRMRRRYGEILREEVGATVESPEEIEDELRLLMAIVSES